MVEATAPDMHLVVQCGEIGDPTVSQTLTAEQAHLDLCLIQPTAALGRITDREVTPVDLPVSPRTA